MATEMFAKLLIKNIEKHIKPYIQCKPPESKARNDALIIIRDAIHETMVELGHNMDDELTYFDKNKHGNLTDEQIKDKILEMHTKGTTIPSICDALAINESTVRNILEET